MKHHRTRTFDLYNLRLCAAAEESATGAYGMPALPPAPADAEPEKLVPFNVAMRLNRVPARRGVHFFIDDYQFDRVWNAPERYVAALRRFDCVFTPDFSLYLDMPRAMKIWNIYRARRICSESRSRARKRSRRARASDCLRTCAPTWSSS